jgi:hypothetical protein
MLRTLIFAVLATAACMPETEHGVIAIRARPTVRPGVAMAVEVFRDGYSELQKHPVSSADRAFEVTVPVDTTWIVATLLDAEDRPVASGEGAPEAEIVLDPAELTINVTSDSAVLADLATGGRQIAHLDGEGFAVVWLDGGFARARAFDDTGLPITTAGTDGEVRAAPLTLDATFPTIEAPSIMALGDSYLVAHQVQLGGVYHGAISELGSDLTGLGVLPEGGLRHAAGAGQLSIAPLGNRIAVAWVESSDAFFGPIHVSTMTREGAPITDHVLAAGCYPQLIERPGGLALLVGDELGVRLEVLGTTGAPVAAPRVLENAIDGGVDPARLVRHGDGFVAAWAAHGGAGRAIRVAAFAADGTPGKRIDVADVAGIDGLALTAAPDGVALAWSVTRAAGAPESGRVVWTQLDDDLAPRFPPRRLTAAVEGQQFPSIVALDEGFAVAWTEIAPITEPTRKHRVRGRIVYPPAP